MVNVCAVDCTSSFEVCWDGSWEIGDYREAVRSGCGMSKLGVVESGNTVSESARVRGSCST